MRANPLLFGFRDAVAGNGFMASVHLNGRALMEFEDGEWWVSGVEPGGILASGATPHEAYAAFREAVRTVLFDSASLTENFAAFERDVQALAGQKNEVAETRWEQARGDIRGGAEPDNEFAAGLPRVTKPIACSVRVVRLDEPQGGFKPQDNKLDLVALSAA